MSTENPQQGIVAQIESIEAVDEFTVELPIDAVLDLDVPRELVLQRLSARRVCLDCGTNYVADGHERT